MAVSVAYRSTGIYNSASTASAVVPAPSGLSDGDLVFAVIRRASTTNPSTVPSGWTLIRSNLATYGFWVYYKIANGEGASWTWGWSASSKTIVRSYAFFGDIDTANPIQNSTTPYSATGSGTVITIPTLTTTSANTFSVLLASAYSTSAKTFTVPTSPAYVEYDDSGNTSPDFWQAVAGYIYPTSGTATGSKAYPASANSTYRVGCEILVNTKEPNFPPDISLGNPVDGANTLDSTPNFTFYGTDIENDAIEFNIQIDTAPTFDSQAGVPLLSKLSASDTGFSAGHPYASNAPVTFSPVTSLSPGSYYWRVRATDPSGSATYGTWSATRTINIVDNLPPTVALGTPVDEATGRSSTPTLSFTGTDPEGDAVEYEVQIDTVSTFDSVPGASGGALFTDGFEAAGWTSTLVSGTNAAWTIATSTTRPGSVPIPEGSQLAIFNSYTAQAGQQARFVPSTSFDIPAGASSATATFKMYHDTGYTTAVDQVQLQISTNGGADWVNVGGVASRYNGTTGWEDIVADISAYAGSTGVLIGLLGISAYGNDCHVDDIRVEYMLPAQPMLSKTSTVDPGFSSGHPYASGVSRTYVVQSSNALTDGAYYWRVRAIDPLGSGTAGLWSQVRSFSVGNLPPTVGTDLPVEGQLVSSTPEFRFVGIDTEDDAIEFNIQIDTAATFDSQSGSPLISALSSSSLGFSSGNPYASGSTVTYTAQSSLALGTYYWRVRAIDPLGKNIYGEWTTGQSFQVVNNAPPYVVLGYPGNGAQGVSPTPTLRFTGSDPEGDAIQYHIQIDDTATFDSNAGGLPGVAFSNSFETATWTSTLVSGSNASWSRATTSSRPSGAVPPNGSYLASFNSYTCPAGAQARYTIATNVTIPDGAGSATLSFWMYKDTQYPTENDRVQLQISRNGGTSWVNVGAPVYRYNGTTGWERATIDISSYIGVANIRIGFLGVSASGNNCHIDDIVINYNSPLLDAHSSSDTGFSAGNPYASGLTVDYTVQPANALTKGKTYYWRSRARDPSGTNTYGPWSAVNGFTPNTGMRIWNGITWVYKPLKVWNGSAWNEKPVKTWDGTDWVIKG